MNRAGPSDKFVVPSRLDQLQQVERQILEAAEAEGFTGNALFAIKLSLEEALTNAIKHGNRSDPKKQVTIEYQFTEDQFQVSVHDQGGGFRPDEIPDPTESCNLEKPCGRGIMLMRAYMDKVTFDRAGTTVTMVKYKASQDTAQDA